MTTKVKLIHAMEALPADATIKDAMDRLWPMAKVECGLQQADAGQTISRTEMEARLAKWSS